MGDHSGIEWTQATWNPVTGCTKVSSGCKNCYAKREWPRLAAIRKSVYHGRAFEDVQCHPDRLFQPLAWQKPRRVFVNSMSDLFHEDVPDEFIDRVFSVMAQAPRHTFQILTKRPDRMRTFMTWIGKDPVSIRYVTGGNVWPLPNVWLGVSVEDQATADERIPLLLQTPAAVRFLSCEPLLGLTDLTSIEWPDKGGHRVDALRRGYWNAKGWLACGPSAALGAERGGFTNHSDMAGIDWVIAGGESGPNARPSHPDWFRSLRDQCAGAGVPFFFKQWGEWAPDDGESPTTSSKFDRLLAAKTNEFQQGGDEHLTVYRIGKRAAGRLLDGREHSEYPT